MAKPAIRGVRLTSKEESFAQAYIFNKGELIEAYRTSDYSQKLTPEQMSVQANKLFNKPRINLRIKELQYEADEIAKKSFTISVKQRLEWLKQITDAGLSEYADANGSMRREGLSAAKSAIDTMNAMLGVSDDESEKAKPLSIVFEVNQAVKEVKITNAST